MAPNRLFVNSALMDAWVASSRVDVGTGTLTVRRTGERFLVDEAVRVLTEATESGDARGWVGLVHRVTDLAAQDVEVLERALVVGDLAYDVDPGFLLEPLGPGAASGALVARFSELSLGQSDEEILARYLIRKL